MLSGGLMDDRKLGAAIRKGRRYDTVVAQAFAKAERKKRESISKRDLRELIRNDDSPMDRIV